MKYLSKILQLASALALTSCISVPHSPMVKAVIIQSNDDSITELNSIVSQALNAKSILLSPKALTNSNRLIIERKPQQTIDQGLLQGRSYEKPQVFTLWKQNGHCVLRHPASDRQWNLVKTHCATKP